MNKYAIGTDIGGSHISCAVVDLEKESIIEGSLVSEIVNNQAPADEILNKWVFALNKSIGTIDKTQLSGIGFAMPGPFDYENGVALFERVAKYEGLYGVNVAESIKKLLLLNGSAKIRFMNDASSFAVGEAWMGKAAGYKHSVSITLGTGFGSAFLDEGIPVVEREDVPNMGCLWHIPYKRGIADDYFSTRWFVKRYAERTGKTLSGAKEIADLVQVDSDAKEVFIEFGRNLGEFLTVWLKLFKAEVLVIGGNISGAYSSFGPSLEARLNEEGINIPVNISELKEDAALVGSAKLLNEPFWEKIKPLLSKM